ncbi:hypothetical protein EPUS_05909 [Endocarpon pusillum Z07020]|uniref:Uncharacterized protein n=1 Tax=Endocarpon pusillum (strain Z07020 / HMAS-L-300199) TaxID=1263415 RepID=U1G8V7_ENDPU|nr:uncharacterized protein EPUS_05909 [Endocarpon pusillum Z07020]ERF73897.1 hypothetical protein EPUS_05909 [Endocarpon pusillum Z07020]
MNVKLELLLTRTVSIDVVDSDIDDPTHLAQQLQGQDQEKVQSMKVVEVNGRQVGTSLNPGSALEVGRDQKIIKFHRLIPALLQKLRRRPDHMMTHLSESSFQERARQNTEKAKAGHRSVGHRY